MDRAGEHGAKKWIVFQNKYTARRQKGTGKDAAKSKSKKNHAGWQVAMIVSRLLQFAEKHIEYVQRNDEMSEKAVMHGSYFYKTENETRIEL